MSETKLLEMTNITKAFASNVVLNGVNLSVDEGEVVAILGENGAGKSTLIKILGGIYKADSGEIRMHGTVKNITSAAVAGENGVRIIHQEIVLVPDRTIAANVFLGREPKNKFGLVDVRAMEQQTQKLIDDLHLNLKANEMVRNLTMGMQQLVEIIKAISAEAKVVVMDEPTSSLSQGEVEILFGIIRLLQKKNIGIIYISHRLEELYAITDRIVVLRDGKMVGDLETANVDKDHLISLMVGRELDSFYTKNKHKIGAKTLFATHYHELTELEEELDGVKNYRIAVKKRGDDITFLRKIVRGGADDSYGSEVAALAGVPKEVINGAKKILKKIENDEIVVEHTAKKHEDATNQIGFGDSIANEIADELKNMDVTTYTPIEAMNKLYELANRAKEI